MKNLGVTEENIKMNLNEIGWERGLDSRGSCQVQMAGCCDQGNETSGSVKCGEFCDWQRNC